MRSRKIVCILCEKVVRKDQKKFMIAVEKPVRIDLTVHRKCFQKNDENSIKTAIKQHIM